MTRSGDKAGWAAAVPFTGLLLLVVWLPVPYGSNVPWAMAVMGMLTFVLLGLWAILLLAGAVKVPKALWVNRWMLALWFIWLGWIILQLIPAKGGPISIMPETTYEQLLLTVTYFGLYLLVLLTASHRDQLRVLGMVIVLSGLAQALYGSLMVLSGLEYGFLARKTTQLGWATGTFINRNHLAGYLEMCAAIGVGLVVADLRAGNSRNWRAWLRQLVEVFLSAKFRVRVFLAIMVIALVLTQSRMGNTAFFTSLLLCGSIYVLLRERRLFVRAVLLLASFLLVDLMIVSEWFGLERVVERIEQTDIATETRTYVFPELVRGADAYWRTGSGLGTFSLAILPFREVMPMKFLDHAHNDYMEFLIEVGMPGCMILACLVLVTMLHALRVILGRRNRLRTGIALSAFMALTALAIHSAVDFNLQIPANAATLVIVMAMVNSCSARSRRNGLQQDSEEDGELSGLPKTTVP